MKLYTYLILICSALTLFTSCKGNKTMQPANHSSTNSNQKPIQMQNIHDFTVKDIEGNDFSFSELKGKKIMVVNTASECGLTPQYKQLEELYQTYKNQNFVVIGFPANNFGGQEPGSNEQIAQFCERNYGVSFPMMSKISVKGDDMHPLYQFLTQKDKNGVQDSEVQWNFQKYLLNPEGVLEKVISPQTLPTDQEVVDWIEKKS